MNSIEFTISISRSIEYKGQHEQAYKPRGTQERRGEKTERRKTKQIPSPSNLNETRGK